MLDAVASRVAKEHGMQLSLAMSGDWQSVVLPEFAAWLATHKAAGNDTMVIEQFRAVAKNVPASSKAWGCLAAIACKAGLIAPLSHPDGSPVMRAAASVKTHGHHVRVWALLDFFPSPGLGKPCPNLHDARRAEPVNQPDGIAHVGDGRHSHSGRHA